MKVWCAVVTTLSLAACGGGTAPLSASDPAPEPPAEGRAVAALAAFEGRIDSISGSFGFRTPGGGDAFLSIAPVAGATLRTTNLTTTGSACGASTTFEGDVTITNNGPTELQNVYAEILTMSMSGRESCASVAVPRPGSDTITNTYGLWAYGSIVAGGSATRRWQFPTPTADSYTFTGRVFNLGELSSKGAGTGLGATINDVLVDSDGASLYVTVQFDRPPAANYLFVLADNVDRTTGMTALGYDPTGSVGKLATKNYPLANGAGADFDYYQVGSFLNGTLSQSHQKTITGAAAATNALGTMLTQDVASGRYNFKIPYFALGALPGDRVNVYVLHGRRSGRSGSYDFGIYSAAPAPPQEQVDRMDVVSGKGLNVLAPAPPSHTLLSVPRACLPPIQFAVIGDYGVAAGVHDYGPTNEAGVAALVSRWDPAFVITVGDNDYDYDFSSTIDENVGQHYHSFIAPYTGTYGGGAPVNAFFPTLGNHDWDNRGTLDGHEYFNYFTLPGNERYYDFVRGEVHFFALDSNDTFTPATVTSLQAEWLHAALAASTSRWKVVYFHHPPYTSGERGSPATYMRWPFQAWGASAVISGHDHHYERLAVDGIPYFINGVGGDWIYRLGTTDARSQFFYNLDHGAQRVVADGTHLTFDFLTHEGVLIDSHTVLAAAPCAP